VDDQKAALFDARGIQNLDFLKFNTTLIGAQWLPHLDPTLSIAS
jgi:hypothetical protein